MNIVTLQKSITNIPKLDRDLRFDSVFGPIYDSLTAKGETLTLTFTAALNQTQIDALFAFVDNFVEIDLLDLEFEMVSKRQVDGSFVYQRLVAKINLDQTLYTGLDQGLQVYPQFITIRNLLRDGFFEFALRYFVRNLIPLGVFTPEQITLAKQWIRAVAIKYGSTPAVLDAIETQENI